MAAVPEDLLLEPFSPSLFLDLPPTPPTLQTPTDGDQDSDDDILPYISRMLMEEDIDDKFFYHYPDHPALLHTQEQPYAQIILSDATSTISSGDFSSGNTTSNGSGSGSYNSTSSPDAPASATNVTTWPYDPLELSQLLHSPPYPDDLFLPGGGDMARPDAGLQQIPPLDNGAAKDGNSCFASDAQNGGTTGVQQSSVSLNGNGEETNTISLPAGDGEKRALPSAFFDGRTGGNVDMLNLAFLRGMEEASKFLPTNTTLLEPSSPPANFFPRETKPTTSPFTAGRVDKKHEQVDAGNGRGRKNRHGGDDLEAEAGRSRKIMVPEQEETGAGEMMEDLMLRAYETFVKGMADLRIAMSSEGSSKAGRGRRRGGAADVVDLRTMLTHCAQAAATGDRRAATELLKQIKQHSSPRGDATQRLAHCFGEGLEARLAGTGSEVYRSLVAQRTSVVEFLRAFKLFLVATPFKKAKFVFANQTILNAVAGKRRLHVVDYGVQYGFQWAGLLQQLASREGGPPEVRITGIDTPQPGFRPACQVEETGRRLRSCAREFRVPFRFHGIAARWETVRAEDLDIDPREVLVVNCQSGLGSLRDGSVAVDGADGEGKDDAPSPRDAVLGVVRRLRPDVFVHCVANGTHGAPFFVTRFREALFYYSAHFDLLDATVPRDNDDRLLIERDIFGRSALNVVACEGADRVERPETYRQWQVRSHRAGLRQVAPNPEVVKTLRDKVRNSYHRDFVVDQDARWLLLGWKGRVLYAMSTWVADDAI